MSEAAKVRLVRCPKCENLLPELTDFSVYQCGGCGALLRAENESIEADTLSEKSDQERVEGGVQEKPEKLHEKTMNLSDGYDKDDGILGGSSSSRAANRWDVGGGADFEENKDMNEPVYSRMAGNFKQSESQNRMQGRSRRAPERRQDFQSNHRMDVVGRYGNSKNSDQGPPNYQLGSSCGYGEPPLRRRNEPNGLQKVDFLVQDRMDVVGTRHGNSKNSDEGPSNYQLGSSYGYGEPPLGRRNEPNGLEKVDFLEQDRMNFVGMRHGNLKNSDEGPSNYLLGSSYGYGEPPLGRRNEPNGLEKVEGLEQDREELLRKLDELKDQISRSRDISNETVENIPIDRKRMVHQDHPYHHGSMQYPRPTPYVNHFDEPIPFMPSNGFYPSNQAQAFGGPFRPQMLGRSSHQSNAVPGLFPRQSAHPYFSGQYMGNDMNHVDPFEVYNNNVNLHTPSCSCSQCYSKHQLVPPDRMFRNGSINSMFQHHENHGLFSPHDYNRRAGNPPPLSSRVPQSHTSRPGDPNPESRSFVHRHAPPPRMAIAGGGGGYHCRPVAGGAPFFACHNCFELLQLPKKLVLVGKHQQQQKMKCGACSATILVSVADKKLAFSVPVEEGRIHANDVDNGLDAEGYERDPRGYAHQNRIRTQFSSEDYDHSGFDLRSMDRELVSSSTGRCQSSDKSAEMRSLHSTSPYTSEEEDSAENLIPRRTKPNSCELPQRASASPQLDGLPPKDQFDYSDKYGGANQGGMMGNTSGRSETEKLAMPQKAASRQNSLKDAAMPTEIDISSNEYAHTGTSLESGEGSRGEDHSRGNRAGVSFFAGFMKRSSREVSRSNHADEQEKINVIVNGRPIPDRLIKKAERLAGPILPGSYWYDFRAGFWGVIGGPCLGIVPPFIEEFSHPMPEKCAGGTTGVFVNGRELHQKDLSLLGNRGLPMESGRSYIVEISGRVLDEDSGLELDGLGKLAPTVEKMKHGFGMKAPRAAAV